MTTSEFSNEFDIYFNNIMSNKAPGLNDYEKSVFLTQAQEAIILEIYNGQNVLNSYESTQEVTSYLNTLTKQVTITEFIEDNGISPLSKFYELPEDLWFITYESVILSDPKLECKDNIEVNVKPITQDTYYNTENNPFRGSSNRRVLRLMKDNKSELISKYNIKSYTVRYICKPDPIILEDLTEYGVSIDGKTEVTECKLNSAIHKAILSKAVVLAKSVWQ